MQITPQNQTAIKIVTSLAQWSLHVGLWAWVWLQYYANDIYAGRGHVLVAGIYGVLLYFFSRFYGGYQVTYIRKWHMAFSCLLALFITNSITYVQISLIWRVLQDPAPMLMMTGVQSAIVFFWAMGAGYVYLHLFPPQRLLLVYGNDQAAERLKRKMFSCREHYIIEKCLSAEIGLEKLISHLQKRRSVMMCEVPAKLRNGLLKYCFEKSVRVYIIPMLSDILVRGALDLHLFDTPLLMSTNQGLNFMQRFIKRSMDLGFTCLGLILTAPIMLLTALAIKLYDGGPVFFYQRRCTTNNKCFNICKFRSMVVDAEKKGPRPATDHDDRITPVGRIIRRLRIDELPQWFNIIKGDMSLVGPRPERIEHVLEYTAKIPEFSFRSKVKAGLTGYAQIRGRYNTNPYDKLKMDLVYIVNYSPLEDLKLILLTAKVLLLKESTAGFQEEETQIKTLSPPDETTES